MCDKVEVFHWYFSIYFPQKNNSEHPQHQSGDLLRPCIPRTPHKDKINPVFTNILHSSLHMPHSFFHNNFFKITQIYAASLAKPPDYYLNWPGDVDGKGQSEGDARVLMWKSSEWGKTMLCAETVKTFCQFLADHADFVDKVGIRENILSVLGGPRGLCG